MLKLNNYSEQFKENLIYLLFSLHIFFWGIDYGFLRLKFFIFLLIFIIIFSINKIIFNKLLKYFFISLIIFIHLFFQSETFSLNYLFFTAGLFLILSVSDVYHNIFINNLYKIIYIFIFFFFSFLIIQFLFQYISTKELDNICIGCFSYYRIFFKENSHLAIIAPSVIFYLLFISNNNKLNKFLLISFIVVCFLNPTLTLYLGVIFLIILTIFFRIKTNNFQKITLIFLISFLLFNISKDKTAQVKLSDTKKILLFNFDYNKKIDSKDVIDTKDVIEHNKKRDYAKKMNLSTEIYKTSLIITKNALTHKPLGYGFNNYNEAFNQFINDIDVYNWETRGLNTKDASNTFVKIVVEFGIFSLFFFYFLISFFFNSRIDSRIKIFLILPISIQLCIRGVGYFNGGFLLFSFIALLMWLDTNSRNNL